MCGNPAPNLHGKYLQFDENMAWMLVEQASVRVDKT